MRIIADYLFDRVAEAGASEIFGVLGDFNLTFLDNVLASDKLRWVGNTNELNAAAKWMNAAARAIRAAA